MKRNEFARYGLHERVVAAAERLGFRTPTPVQERSIPLWLQKRNLIVEAPTGTGKTAAYGFPLLSMLNLQKRATQALVMTPSRELAEQVAKALQSYFDGDQLRIGAVYGGAGSLADSFAIIKSAPHVLVAAPGRLRDVMSQYQYDYLWRDIKYLIIDEGDKLLESGFQHDLDEIRSRVRKQVQIGFFSATISPDSETLIRERFQPVMTLRLDARKALRHIQFYEMPVSRGNREGSLASLLEQERVGQALIFCGRRETVVSITQYLRNRGLPAEGYYGNQTPLERGNILRRFSEGAIHYLVASDLAARGLDIPNLPAVVNLHIPDLYDYYLHRVGRTGRAGRPGKVFNLTLTESDKARLSRHHESLGLPLLPLALKETQAAESSRQEQRWVRVLLSRGKRDKIRPGDVAGFLIHHSGAAPGSIGTITIEDSYTLVDLPEEMAASLQQESGELKIKGKSLKIRSFRAEDEEKKAAGVQKLQRDRNSPRNKRAAQ